MTSLLARRRSVAAGFVPQDIANLGSDLDAERTGLADYAMVQTWLDRSGNARNATQATATRRPRLLVDPGTGRRFLRFDGIDDYLMTGSFPVTAQRTIFAVVRHTNQASGTQMLVCADRSASATSTRVFQLTFSATGLAMGAFDSGGASFFDSVSHAGVDRLQVLAVTRGASSVETFADQVTNGSTATTGTPASATRPISIGARADASGVAGEYCSMDVFRILIYERVLTAAEQAKVYAYLQRRYGATPALTTYEGLDTATTATALPTAAKGTYAWNAQPFCQDNLVTVGGTQYAVYVDSNTKPVVTKRTLPAGVWDTPTDLSLVSGNPLASPMASDAHNVLSMAVDADGHIHIIGNMHNNSVRYVRSTNPNDITAWAAGPAIPSTTVLMSYPQLFKLLDGTLLLTMREGGSGDADQRLYRYNTTTDTWSYVGKIVDGLATGESPYVQHVAVDQTTGRIVLMLVWRADSADSWNTDISYMHSDDGGTTWEKFDGTAYALPVTHTTIDKVYPQVQADGILNNGGLEIDTNGHPHGVWRGTGSNGVQNLFHVYWDGSAWQKDQITTFDSAPGRGQVACLPDGRVWIIYQAVSTVFLCDVTNPAAPTTTPLYARPSNGAEPVLDTEGLYNDGLVHFMVHRTAQDGSGPASTTGYVVTVDPDLVAA